VLTFEEKYFDYNFSENAKTFCHGLLREFSNKVEKRNVEQLFAEITSNGLTDHTAGKWKQSAV